MTSVSPLDHSVLDESTQTRLAELLGQLTLDEKVLVLTGHDFWATWPIEKIGLRRILVSDGPSGVRGEVWDERSPSLNLPPATALASSWDVGILAATAMPPPSKLGARASTWCWGRRSTSTVRR